MTRLYKWGMIGAILFLMSLVPATWFIFKPDTMKMVPVIVVEKVSRPMNPGYLVGGSPGLNKELQLIFKKQVREPEYIVVCVDPNGIEYNVNTDRISFTKIKVLDTLWTTK